MYTGYTFGLQLLGLHGTPFYPHLLGIIIIFAVLQLFGQRFWQIYMEHFGQDSQLIGQNNGLYARNNRDINTFGATTLDKSKIFVIIEKHLCYHITGTSFYLFFQIIQIRLRIWSFIMFFRIPRNTIRKRSIHQ